MTRVLFLSPEPVRPTMAGIGIRFLSMARTLAADFDVRLAIPNDPGDLEVAPGGAELVRYGLENLAELTAASDVVVAHGHTADLYLRHGRTRPFVVDLYDPFPIENLNYVEELGEEPYFSDRQSLLSQARAGDLFLCSCEEQRLFYLGLLFSVGRLNPGTFVADPSLHNLVRVVPFGVPDAAPQRTEPVVRGVLPGVGETDPILLFGGIYDWYDPGLLLDVLPDLLEKHPDLRLLFAANPNPETTPQSVYAEVQERSRRQGWLDRHVFFVPWVEHARRGDLYLEATLAVVLHRPSLETELSMRTRVLEYLWAGLPVIATRGGSASRLLEREGAGLLIESGDRRGLAEALHRLLDSERLRRDLADRGRAWAARHRWREVLEPLHSFLHDPRIDPYKRRYRLQGLRSHRLVRKLLRRLAPARRARP